MEAVYGFDVLTDRPRQIERLLQQPVPLLHHLAPPPIQRGVHQNRWTRRPEQVCP
jgi:hypothetical protein